MCMEGFLRGRVFFFPLCMKSLVAAKTPLYAKINLPLKRIADPYTMQITLHKCRLSILVLKDGLLSMCMAGFYSVFVLGHL